MKTKFDRISKEFALNCAKPFCEANGYDYNRLSNLRFVTVNSACGFCFEPLDNGEGGLTVDMLSMPRPVIAIYKDGSIETYPLLEELRTK